MKYRYTKYTGDLLDEIDLEDLVSKLSDLLLTSGFRNPWGNPLDSDEDRSMQALHDAILEALFSGGVLSDDALQRLLGERLPGADRPHRGGARGEVPAQPLNRPGHCRAKGRLCMDESTNIPTHG